MLCNSVVDINFVLSNVINISNMFRIVIINNAVDITFFGFFPALISLLIASWILKLANDSNNEYVGIIREYNDIPSKPIILV